MATETNISINQDRLWDSLMTMAKIGPGIAGGNNRQTVTLEDGEARNLLQKWSEEAGMTMKVDELGSMFLKREGTDKNALPVVIGSHLDTQPTGGKYDGVLGVLAGLEIIRTLNDLNIQTKHSFPISDTRGHNSLSFILRVKQFLLIPEIEVYHLGVSLIS